ncbi:MAG: polymer-forming cytoskeletal protein [Thermodesulfobacteriota bacterium]
MFGKPVKEESTGIGEIIGFIGKGVQAEGKLIFDGTVRIDGRFKGEVESNGTLVIGEDALIEATLNIDTIVVSGEIRGVINAKSRVELRGPGKVFGDIRTPTLIVGEGVIFEGNCMMVKRDVLADSKMNQ